MRMLVSGKQKAFTENNPPGRQMFNKRKVMQFSQTTEASDRRRGGFRQFDQS